jgi:hypothetical protein
MTRGKAEWPWGGAGGVMAGALNAADWAGLATVLLDAYGIFLVGATMSAPCATLLKTM